MDNEVKVTNIKSLIITSLIIVVVITMGTFAWLSYRSKSTAMVLTIGNVNDIQITLKPYQLDLELSPVLTYTSLDANEEYVTVSVTNNSSSQQYFSLFYDISHIDSSLVSSDFKYTILKSADNWSTSNMDTSGNFSSANTTNDFYILDEVSIPANTIWYYRVYTWVDGTNNPNVSNAVFKANLQAKLWGSTKPLPLFIRGNAVMDNINSTYVNNSTPGVDFSAISSDTNGKGIYLRAGTENTAHPIYYYRGEVNNNNLLFAGFCWKIVRTTDTGGIKLIYNGVPSNGTCNNTGTAAQISTTSKFNSERSSIADVGYMYGTRYTISSFTSSNLTSSYKYGNSVTYSNGTYTLIDIITSTGTWANDYNTLNNNHYTCLNNTGSCTSVYYIYSTNNVSTDGATNAHYITLNNGKSVNDAISEMYTNTNSSAIKTVIDTWYSSNMTSYTNMLEDTPWCNDRTIDTSNGWNPNGGDTVQTSFFAPYKRVMNINQPSFICDSVNDSFTVSSTRGNGDLTYPVGLITADEAAFAGSLFDIASANGISNETYYLYTGTNYHTISPFESSGAVVDVISILNDGRLGLDYYGLLSWANNSYNGVRPMVSLKPGLTYSGSGTTSDPYTVS